MMMVVVIVVVAMKCEHKYLGFILHLLLLLFLPLNGTANADEVVAQPIPLEGTWDRGNDIRLTSLNFLRRDPLISSFTGKDLLFLSCQSKNIADRAKDFVVLGRIKLSDPDLPCETVTVYEISKPLHHTYPLIRPLAVTSKENETFVILSVLSLPGWIGEDFSGDENLKEYFGSEEKALGEYKDPKAKESALTGTEHLAEGKHGLDLSVYLIQLRDDRIRDKKRIFFENIERLGNHIIAVVDKDMNLYLVSESFSEKYFAGIENIWPLKLKVWTGSLDKINAKCEVLPKGQYYIRAYDVWVDGGKFYAAWIADGFNLFGWTGAYFGLAENRTLKTQMVKLNKNIMERSAMKYFLLRFRSYINTDDKIFRNEKLNTPFLTTFLEKPELLATRKSIGQMDVSAKEKDVFIAYRDVPRVGPGMKFNPSIEVVRIKGESVTQIYSAEDRGVDRLSLHQVNDELVLLMRIIKKGKVTIEIRRIKI
jgi:hypothetical protein